MPRPRGLPAHIDNVRPVPDHLLRVEKRRVDPAVLSAVRERVRRHIQDPHNVCLMFRVKFPAAYSHRVISLFFISYLFFLAPPVYMSGSIFFFSALQSHALSAGQAKHVRDALSLV